VKGAVEMIGSTRHKEVCDCSILGSGIEIIGMAWKAELDIVSGQLAHYVLEIVAESVADICETTVVLDLLCRADPGSIA
jgi:hypothetical protein